MPHLPHDSPRATLLFLSYVTSLLILVCYGVVVAILADDGEEHLGWANIGAVVVLDLVTLLMCVAKWVGHRWLRVGLWLRLVPRGVGAACVLRRAVLHVLAFCGLPVDVDGLVCACAWCVVVRWCRYVAELFSSAAFICVVMMVSRGAIVSVGPRWWFVGHAAVYLVYGCALAYKVAERRILIGAPLTVNLEAVVASEGDAAADPAAADAAAEASEAGSSDDEGEGGVAPRGARGDLGDVEEPRGRRVVKSPEFVLAVLTVAFCIDLVVARFIKPDGLNLPKVPLFESQQHQYLFGVAAVMAVAIFLVLCVAQTHTHAYAHAPPHDPPCALWCA